MGDGHQGRPELHDFQSEKLQLSAVEVRSLVADAVPPLGHGRRSPDYQGVAKQVMRGDLYEEAMKELGYKHGGANNDRGAVRRRGSTRPSPRIRQGVCGPQAEGITGHGVTRTQPRYQAPQALMEALLPGQSVPNAKQSFEDRRYQAELGNESRRVVSKRFQPRMERG